MSIMPLENDGAPVEGHGREDVGRDRDGVHPDRQFRGASPSRVNPQRGRRLRASFRIRFSLPEKEKAHFFRVTPSPVSALKCGPLTGS